MTDSFGASNVADTALTILLVTSGNVAPTVNGGSDATVDEGSPFSGSGSFSDPGSDTWTATVDYGDGSGPQPLALNPDKTFDLSHIYADNGSYTVTVSVEDDDTGVGSDSLLVTVNSVLPEVRAVDMPAIGVRRQPLTFSADFSDPGFDRPAAGTREDFTATINWGDGTGDSAATIIEMPGTDGTATTGTAWGEHIYADVGTYTVICTLRDDDGGQVVANFETTIEIMAVTEDPHDPTRQALLIGGTANRDEIYLSQYKNGDVKAYIKSPKHKETFSLGPNDRIYVYAREGNDYVKFYSSVTHDAVIDGGPGNDRLYGGKGNDQLDGGDGDDRLYGNRGHDVLLGGSGNDSLYGSRDNDKLDGGDGNDKLYGSSGNDTLLGGPGHDYLTASSGNDLLDGGSHDDRLYGGSGNDSMLGGSGNDRLSGSSGNDTLSGGSDHDYLSAGSGNDRLDGGDGNDKLYGSSGNDLLFGALGNDYLSGSSGNDILLGGPDADSLLGGSGRDLLIGGTGNDSLSGSLSYDVLIGGTTDHDANDHALLMILAEWTRRTPVDDRIANLRDGGGLNGAILLSMDNTVHDDGDEDVLRGGSSSDWFLFFGDDFLRDKGSRDR